MALAKPTTDSERTELAIAYVARRLGVPSLNAHQKQAVHDFLGGKDGCGTKVLLNYLVCSFGNDPNAFESIGMYTTMCGDLWEAI